MSNDDTLLAYLVPKLTNQVENAATDGLCYILKKSESAMDAFNLILQQGGYAGNPIVSVETQVTYGDGSRPDMTGYDEDGIKRLLVEAKFWAALLGDQASRYLEQFDEPGPAMLLFIAPQARIETLWVEIIGQIEEAGGRSITDVDISNHSRYAIVDGDEKRVMLVSWRNLLGQLAASASANSVAADIQQLRGLAEGQDTHAFLPVHGDDVSRDIGRRISGYSELAKEVVDLGVTEKWLDVKGLRTTPQWYGYGRFFRFPGVELDFWIGVNYWNWGMRDSTPLWLEVRGRIPISMDTIGNLLGVRVYDRWIPIHLKQNVEYHVVLADVACQLKEIGRVVGANTPGK